MIKKLLIRKRNIIQWIHTVVQFLAILLDNKSTLEVSKFPAIREVSKSIRLPLIREVSKFPAIEEGSKFEEVSKFQEVSKSIRLPLIREVSKSILEVSKFPAIREVSKSIRLPLILSVNRSPILLLLFSVLYAKGRVILTLSEDHVVREI